MELYYNGTALHALGDVVLQGESRRGIPERNPQRYEVTMRVRLELFADTWKDNYDLVTQLDTAAIGQHKVLRWVDPAGGERLNQTAQCEPGERTEPNDAGGTRQQRREFTFRFYESVVSANDEMTFVKTGNVTPLSIGGVARWSENFESDRVSPYSSVRRRSGRRVVVAGQWLADPTAAVATRRAALLAQRDTWMAEVNGADGTLTRGGGFSKAVRIENLQAEVNEALDAIDFTFTAAFTEYPTESDFAWIEFTTATRLTRDAAEQILSFTGRIQATDEVKAIAKLDAIRATTLAARGYQVSQRVSESYDPQTFDGTDGTAFVEYRFEEQYRRFVSNFEVTFEKTGSGSPVALGYVVDWSENYETERFHVMRSIRRRTEGTVAARGRFVADPEDDESTRRADLMAQKNALIAAIDGADGQLIRSGSFDKTVRATRFRADINQAFDAVEWTLSATFTQHPNEATYAAAEYTVQEQEDRDSRRTNLTLSGRVSAANEAAALAKLDAIRTATLAARGYYVSQRTAATLTRSKVDADDGAAFLEIQFQESYRGWLTGADITFTPEGGVELAIGRVGGWVEVNRVARFHNMRDARRETIETVQVSGTLVAADLSADESTRQASLFGLKESLKASLNDKRGRLVRSGCFDADVRVEGLQLEINQAQDGIAWSFTAHHTLFPDESDYAAAEYEASVRTNKDTGELTLSLSGRVAATSGAKANILWSDIRTATLAAKGFKLAGLRTSESKDGQARSEDGEEFLERTYTEEYRAWTKQPDITFQRDGGALLNLGAVTRWTEGWNTDRFDVTRSERKRVGGRVSAAGRITLADLELDGDEASRKTDLFTLKNSYRDELLEKEGTLKRAESEGGFSQLVRVESFEVEVTQNYDALAWVMTAAYTHFPNEADFGTAEITVGRREGKESGEVIVTFSGTVDAETRAGAVAKLDAIRTAYLDTQGVTVNDRVSASLQDQNFDADDGAGFVSLSFNEEYKATEDGVLSWTLRQSDQDDLASGLLRTTISGSVVAGGADADTAYATALAKARALGDGKYALRTTATETRNDRRVDEAGVNPGTQRFVGLDFSYEYLRKGSKVYMEATTEFTTPLVGDYGETVQGFVVADTLANARAEYVAKIKTPYTDAGRLVLEERMAEGRRHYKTGGSYVAHLADGMPSEVRLEFALSLHRPRLDSETSCVYAIEVSRDAIENTLTTRISGQVLTSTEANGDAFLTAFLAALSLGTINPGGRRVKDWVTQPAEPYGPSGTAKTRLRRISFDEVYVEKLSGVAALLACEVSEEVLAPGVRWVLQAIPSGASVPQNCGIEPGRRSVRGRVLATDEAAALAWMVTKLDTFLTGNYKTQLQSDGSWRFLPMTDGNVGGEDSGTPNWHVFELRFQQGEHILS